MTTKALDTQLQQFWPLLAKDQKQSILSVIKSFVNHQETSVSRLTIEEYNREIDDAMERVKNGQFLTHAEVEEMAKKW